MGANLYAAYRLPDNCFDDAKVTVDLVFFQKITNQAMRGSSAWCNAPYCQIGKNRHRLNQHFIQHPEHVLGTLTEYPLTRYNRMDLTCKLNGNLINQMAQALKALPALSKTKQPHGEIKQTIQQVLVEAEALLTQLR
tara:strand:- start:1489 stop:1899 length:411 start_codon:yes stop_codon:yes gene_type:complete